LENIAVGKKNASCKSVKDGDAQNETSLEGRVSLANDEGGEWLDDDAQKYEFSTIMHAGLEIFESHFPNLPLLPGFMQLDYVFELACGVGIDVSGASTVENLKFSASTLIFTHSRQPAQFGLEKYLPKRLKPRLARASFTAKSQPSM